VSQCHAKPAPSRHGGRCRARRSCATRPRARPVAHGPPTRQPQPGAARSRPAGSSQPHPHIVARGRRDIAVLRLGRGFNRTEAKIQRRGAAIPRPLDPGDLRALCASTLNLCVPAGVPAEPGRAAATRTTGLRVRASLPPPVAVSPAPAVPLEPSRIDPLNREPTAKPGPIAPFKPSRIDPLNREPGAFPDPRPVHRIHDPASYPRIHAMRRTREASAAGKESLPRMNADERR
jgi:hypothetical protein